MAEVKRVAVQFTRAEAFAALDALDTDISLRLAAVRDDVVPAQRRVRTKLRDALASPDTQQATDE